MADLQSLSAQVGRIYLGLLNRDADVEGLQFWVDRISSGQLTLESVANAFLASPEFAGTPLAGSDPEAFLDALYERYFNRDPDAGGLEFWTNLLAAGTSRGQVAAAFAQVQEAIDNTADAIEEALFPSFVAILTGDQESTPNDSEAIGTAELTVDLGADTYDADLAVPGIAQDQLLDVGALNSPVHLHLGAPGEDGPVVLNLGADGTISDLPDGVPGNGFQLNVDDGDFDDIRSADFADDADLLQALEEGNAYFNVHTIAFPNGEVRGQTQSADDADDIPFTASLSGDQEVPPVATEASGTATLTVDGDRDTYDLDLDVAGIDPDDLFPVGSLNSAVHLHLGEAGVNGPVVLNLAGAGTITDTEDGFSLEVDDGAFADISNVGLSPQALLAAMIEEGTYFNVHTNANNAGEIRGQATTDIDALVA